MTLSRFNRIKMSVGSGTILCKKAEKNIAISPLICYTNVATQINICTFWGSVFLVKTLALLLSFLKVCQKICVAAIGVVRFSVRSFGCALFYL